MIKKINRNTMFKMIVLISILSLCSIINGNKTSFDISSFVNKSRNLLAFDTSFSLEATGGKNIDAEVLSDGTFVMVYESSNNAYAMYFDSEGVEITGSQVDITGQNVGTSLKISVSKNKTYVAWIDSSDNTKLKIQKIDNTTYSLDGTPHVITSSNSIISFAISMSLQNSGAIFYVDSSGSHHQFISSSFVFSTVVDRTITIFDVESYSDGSDTVVTFAIYDTSVNNEIKLEKYINGSVQSPIPIINSDNTEIHSNIKITSFSDYSYFVAWHNFNNSNIEGAYVSSDLSTTVSIVQIKSSISSITKLEIRANSDEVAVSWIDTDLHYIFVQKSTNALTDSGVITSSPKGLAIFIAPNESIIIDSNATNINAIKKLVIFNCDNLDHENLKLIFNGAYSSSNTFEFTEPQTFYFRLESGFAATDCFPCIGYIDGQIANDNNTIDITGNSITLTDTELGYVESCKDPMNDCIFTITLINRCYNNMVYGTWEQTMGTQLAELSTATFIQGEVDVFTDVGTNPEDAQYGASIELIECNESFFCPDGSLTNFSSTAGELAPSYQLGSLLTFQIFSDDDEITDMVITNFTYTLNSNTFTVDITDLSDSGTMSDPYYQWEIVVSTESDGSGNLDINVVVAINSRRLLAGDEVLEKQITVPLSLTITLNPQSNGTGIGIILAIVFGLLIFAAMMFLIIMWGRKGQKNISKVTNTERTEIVDNNNKVEVTI